MSKYDFDLEISYNTSTGIIVNKIKPGSVVLEFGCANGRMTKYLKYALKCDVYIVEVDEEAYKEAYAFAKDGVCGDAMELKWKDHFHDIKFDVILFADVLEHLIDPELVLSNSAEMLKDDGFIYISIPNITHNDLITKAFDDHFDYSNVGLLDSSHIHFWGKENLVSFSEKCGLYLVKLESTVCASGTTEQYSNNYFFDNHVMLMNILRERPYGEVYQFIVTLSKDSSASCQDTAAVKPFITSCLYLDTGKGFNAEEAIPFNSLLISSGVYNSHFVFNNAESVLRLRYDPIEGQHCIIQNMVVRQGSNILNGLGVNSLELDSGLLMRSKDPQIIFEIPTGDPVIIDADVTIISEQYISLIENNYETLTVERNDFFQQINTIKSENESLTDELFLEHEHTIQLEEQLSVVNAKISSQNKKIDELNESIDSQKETINELLSENESFKLEKKLNIAEINRCSQELNVISSQNNILKQDKDYWENAYNIISQSQFWKLTAPMRFILDGIKRVLKKNKFTYLICKGLLSLKRAGFRATWQKVRKYFVPRETKAKYSYQITKKERSFQERYNFNKEIKISILVPLYNTPTNFFSDMITSVLKQTYKNWELCLADGSDEQHSEIEKLALKFAQNDNRIKYLKLENNLGISENTNKCIEMVSGEYLALFDHDDMLHPSVLYEVVKTIESKSADFIYTDEATFRKTPADAYNPHFKPDYSPDTLRSYNYICHFTVFSYDLLKKAGGGFRKEFDGSQDYDIILRLTEKAKKIVHIPKVLYYWRAHETSVAEGVSAKPYTITAAKKALSEHLERVGLCGEVIDSVIPSTYRIRYKIDKKPLISILIPNKDHVLDLKKCIDSILNRSTYTNFEIVVVENNSTESETFEYYNILQKDERIKVVVWEHEFNYSKINNFGAKYCNGEYLVLLNNDIEIITENWLEEMLMFAQRSDVGAVGAMLYYPDDTIQHAGIILGIGGVAGHSHKYFKRGAYGYTSRLTIAQNLSCVTAACLMVSMKVWNEINGLNENYAIAFNDVDLCMRIRKAGYLIVWTPYAEAYHYESKSRGIEDTPEKQKRFQSEVLRFYEDWDKELKEGDPYYNTNLTLEREDFSVK